MGSRRELVVEGPGTGCGYCLLRVALEESAVKSTEYSEWETASI